MSFLSQPITLQSLFGKKRSIGPIQVNVIVSESTTDVLTITKQPVQQGAAIADHAYKEPVTLNIQILQQDTSLLPSLSDILSPLNPPSLVKLYQQFLDLQSSRVPFDVITPKRIYHNMLMATLGVTTDRHTESVLSISASFQEVIIVSVVTTQVSRGRQRAPQKTGATVPVGKKSALESLKEGITSLFGGG